MDAPAELVECGAIAESLGLVIDDLHGYPPSFETYLIAMRVRTHLTRLRREIHDLELTIQTTGVAA